MKRRSLDICLTVMLAGIIAILIIIIIFPQNIFDFIIESDWISLVVIDFIVVLISLFIFWINVFGIATDRKEYIWAVAIFCFSPISIIYYIINRKNIK